MRYKETECIAELVAKSARKILKKSSCQKKVVLGLYINLIVRSTVQL